MSDIFKLFEPGEPKVGIVIGTGPSLTVKQLTAVREFRWFGVNNALFHVGRAGRELDVHLACNVEWYDYYAELRAVARYAAIPSWIAVDAEHPERAAAARRHGLRAIGGVWMPGLATSRQFLAYHHGAGPQAINLAYHYGCKVIGLLGFDLRYRPDKRHYFGEYPKPLQHHPRTGPNGELLGLIRELCTIKPADYGIQIYNLTPRSALQCFHSPSISEFLDAFGRSRE